jgi:hypothetical protein
VTGVIAPGLAMRVLIPPASTEVTSIGVLESTFRKTWIV